MQSDDDAPFDEVPFDELPARINPLVSSKQRKRPDEEEDSNTVVPENDRGDKDDDWSVASITSWISSSLGGIVAQQPDDRNERSLLETSASSSASESSDANSSGADFGTLFIPTPPSKGPPGQQRNFQKPRNLDRDFKNVDSAIPRVSLPTSSHKKNQKHSDGYSTTSLPSDEGRYMPTTLAYATSRQALQASRTGHQESPRKLTPASMVWMKDDVDDESVASAAAPPAPPAPPAPRNKVSTLKAKLPSMRLNKHSSSDATGESKKSILKDKLPSMRMNKRSTSTSGASGDSSEKPSLKDKLPSMRLNKRSSSDTTGESKKSTLKDRLLRMNKRSTSTSDKLPSIGMSKRSTLEDIFSPTPTEPSTTALVKEDSSSLLMSKLSDGSDQSDDSVPLQKLGYAAVLNVSSSSFQTNKSTESDGQSEDAASFRPDEPSKTTLIEENSSSESSDQSSEDSIYFAPGATTALLLNNELPSFRTSISSDRSYAPENSASGEPNEAIETTLLNEQLPSLLSNISSDSNYVLGDSASGEPAEAIETSLLSEELPSFRTNISSSDSSYHSVPDEAIGELLLNEQLPSFQTNASSKSSDAPEACASSPSGDLSNAALIKEELDIVSSCPSEAEDAVSGRDDPPEDSAAGTPERKLSGMALLQEELPSSRTNKHSARSDKPEGVQSEPYLLRKVSFLKDKLHFLNASKDDSLDDAECGTPPRVPSKGNYGTPDTTASMYDNASDETSSDHIQPADDSKSSGGETFWNRPMVAKWCKPVYCGNIMAVAFWYAFLLCAIIVPAVTVSSRNNKKSALVALVDDLDSSDSDDSPTPPTVLPTQAPSTLPTLSLSPSSQPTTTASPTAEPVETTFYAVGDVPYRDSEKIELAEHMLAIPDDAEFLIHVGDIRSGDNETELCKFEDYEEVRDILLRSPVPVFIIPGGKCSACFLLVVIPHLTSFPHGFLPPFPQRQ